MAAMTLNIGRKKVAVTAYCLDDIYGLGCCEYALQRIEAMFERPVPEVEVRAWLLAKDPCWADVFAQLDAGQPLPKNPAFAVDPSNVQGDVACAMHMRQESKRGGWR